MAISINLNPPIPSLHRIADKRKINLRYALITPFATAHIHWNEELNELVYEIEEPILNENAKKALDDLENAMFELINVNVVVDNSMEATTKYIDKTARLLIDELNLKIDKETYERIFYYLF